MLHGHRKPDRVGLPDCLQGESLRSAGAGEAIRAAAEVDSDEDVDVDVVLAGDVFYSGSMAATGMPCRAANSRKA